MRNTSLSHMNIIIMTYPVWIVNFPTLSTFTYKIIWTEQNDEIHRKALDVGCVGCNQITKQFHLWAFFRKGMWKTTLYQYRSQEHIFFKNSQMKSANNKREPSQMLITQHPQKKYCATSNPDGTTFIKKRNLHGIITYTVRVKKNTIITHV